MKEEKKQHILAMGLRLAEATGFEVVGEKGAENFQFLFSQFKKMIENDHQCQLVDKDAKESVLQSLDHTIDFYNAKKTEDVQKLIESLKNNDNKSFVIIPVYKTEKYIYDNVHCLLIHKKGDQYVVTKTDKDHNIIYYSPFKEINEKANFYTKISEKELPLLSQILFLSKQDHHKESEVDIASCLHDLSAGKRIHLAVSWSGYQSVHNCPINEPLATLRVALYNCRHDIFTHTAKKPFKPKLGTSKDFHNHFFQTFIGNDPKSNSYYQALWQIYEERKNKDYGEKAWQKYKEKTNIEPRFKDTFLQQHFVEKTLDLPDTPEIFKTAHKLRAKDENHYFKVFTSDSKHLKVWDTYKFVEHSLANKESEKPQAHNQTIQNTYRPFRKLFSQSPRRNKQFTRNLAKKDLER